MNVHISYLAIIATLLIASVLGYVGMKSWADEKAARAVAEAQVKLSEAAIKTLEAQITSRDQQAAKEVQVVVKTIHDVVTPAQAISAIPILSDVPLNVRPATDNATQVSVDAIPLAQELATAKVCSIQLPVCQKDLADEKTIVVQKDAEITAFKRPKGFWSRVKSTAKVLGIGIGIGLMAAHSL